MKNNIYSHPLYISTWLEPETFLPGRHYKLLKNIYLFNLDLFMKDECSEVTIQILRLTNNS